ncbi:MAG: cobalamin-dependent protein, partial [Mogibacterium sp.]|nr:cobalamin-dependent protein [Mogibacterium sp.]
MKLLLTTIKSDNKQTELALKYLYSVLFDSPLDVHVKAYGRNELYSDIFEEIVTSQYEIVYFHADSGNIRQLCRVADMVKKAIPDIAIIFGGMEVSFETRAFVKQNDFVDYVIRGEGESVMFNFLKSVLDYEFDFENIAGLAYREGDQVVVNPYDAPVEMESLPFPYEKFEVGSGTVYYESIRGTSDRTVYSQFLPNARVRALSLGRVCTELRYFLA